MPPLHLTPRLRRVVLFVLVALSFVGLFPVSMRLSDQLFTQPFHPGWKYPVLLVWPDHVEMRWFRELSEVTPRPHSAGYTFNVAPERQAWVEKEVRNTPSPNGNAAWIIHVKQLGPSRQQIQLELLGDGITGMIYEAGPQEIVLLKTRLTGAGGGIIILGIHLLLWGFFWFSIRLVSRLVSNRRRRPSIPPPPLVTARKMPRLAPRHS